MFGFYAIKDKKFRGNRRNLTLSNQRHDRSSSQHAYPALLGSVTLPGGTPADHLAHKVEEQALADPASSGPASKKADTLLSAFLCLLLHYTAR